MALEIEAKYLGVDLDDTRQRLKKAGFKCLRERALMRRRTYTMFDADGNVIKEAWGRVRDEGDKVTMTFKRIDVPDALDGMLEHHLTVAEDFETAVAFMGELGHTDYLEQENYREVWQWGDVEACIDEWPALRPYIEIEAPSAELVNSVSEELGFNPDDAIIGSAGTVYQIELGITEIGLAKKLNFEDVPDAETLLDLIKKTKKAA